MNYFIDTEFHEGFHKPLFGRNRHFIDLISIGIVSEDGRELYAISKDFDVKAAWNAWQPRTGQGENNSEPKEYWLRENVLRQLYDEYFLSSLHQDYDFTLSNLKKAIKEVGKSNKQIAEEIKKFIYPDGLIAENSPIQFYGYYSDYDWVLFCSLFGTMMDLPKFFPMFCYDLKQTMNTKMYSMDEYWNFIAEAQKQGRTVSEDDCIDIFIKSDSFPIPDAEHNALADAIWNKRLYEYLDSF